MILDHGTKSIGYNGILVLLNLFAYKLHCVLVIIEKAEETISSTAITKNLIKGLKQLMVTFDYGAVRIDQKQIRYLLELVD